MLSLSGHVTHAREVGVICQIHKKITSCGDRLVAGKRINTQSGCFFVFVFLNRSGSINFDGRSPLYVALAENSPCPALTSGLLRVSPGERKALTVL